MDINTLFGTIGAIFLIAACVLIFIYIKLNKTMKYWPFCQVLFTLGIAICIGVGLSGFVAHFIARDCPNCGILVKSNYCTECGYQVRTEEYPKELFCAECGADIITNSNFCGRCGADVKED